MGPSLQAGGLDRRMSIHPMGLLRETTMTDRVAVLPTPSQMVVVVSLSGGALLANGISVVLLVAETISVRR